MCQLAFLKNEWLDSLQTLQKQWGGKLNDGLSETSDGRPNYASLTSQIGPHKVFLDRGVSSPCLIIYLWGDWGIELLLDREIPHDRFLKSIGLEYELTLEGSEIDILSFNKKFLIKGAPPELIKLFLSEHQNRALVDDLGDFESLHIKNGLLRIIYEFNYEEQIRPDTLNDRVNNVIKFVKAIEDNKSIPKLIREKFVPKPAQRPIALDFNNRKTVAIVLVVELLLLAVFGNTIIKYFLLYSASHDISYRNGGILVLLIFGIPLSVMVFLTIRQLMALSTISSCGVTLDSTRIKPGDTVCFAVGLSALRTIKIKEIIFTFNNNITEYVGAQATKSIQAYSKNYTLANDLMIEQGRPYVFKAQMSIPDDAVPSGDTKDEFKRSVINALALPEYCGRTSIWTHRVEVRIDYYPDYSFEQEFKVYPS